MAAFCAAFWVSFRILEPLLKPSVPLACGVAAPPRSGGETRTKPPSQALGTRPRPAKGGGILPALEWLLGPEVIPIHFANAQTQSLCTESLGMKTEGGTCAGSVRVKPRPIA